MKKYIVPLFFSILTFFAVFFLLKQLKVTPDELRLELDALVLENDVFQLFYCLEGADNFTEKHSVKTIVLGNNKTQKIEFLLPFNTPIIKLRIDIGENEQQKLMKINSVQLKSAVKTFQYDVFKDFTSSTFVQSEKKGIKTYVVNNQYDPFFESDFEVKNAIETLNKPGAMLNSMSVIFLSLTFALSVFFVCYYQESFFKFSDSHFLIILFFMILFTPMFVSLLNIDVHSAAEEKRTLASKPVFNITKDYPKQFEEYYNDNFGLRTFLVNLNSRVKLDLFRVSPKPSAALLGKEGFMFYNLKSDDIYKSYTNTNLMGYDALKDAFQKQKAISDTLASKNIQYVLGFFPNKHTVYPEMMPFAMKKQIRGGKSFADQVVSYFNAENFNLIDVREELFSAKKENQLYYKLDTHWNSYGSYVGYQAFCNQTFQLLGLTSYGIEDFNIKYSQESSGDLTDFIGVDKVNYYFDKVPVFELKDQAKMFEVLDANTEYPPRTIITLNKNCNNNETVLVFRDSFSTALIQFLSLHYNKVIYIWSPTIDMEMIERVKPEIVMLLCVERNLNEVLSCY